MKRIIIGVALFVLFNPFSLSFAHDTDIYTVPNGVVQPNVMIMFDNSGSMNDPATGEVYDPAKLYPYVYSTSPKEVYYNVTGQTWNLHKTDFTQVECAEAKTALQNSGFYTGTYELTSTKCNGGRTVNLRTGNFMNYLQVSVSDTQPRLGLAKGIIQSYVNTTYGVRFGAMIFNPVIDDGSEGGNSEGGHILREVRDMTATNRSDLHSAIGAIKADTWTPLAETLYEAGLYFKGAPSRFNKDASGNPIKYTSPIGYDCQKSYLIIITDGEPSKDNNDILRKEIPAMAGAVAGDYDGDGREPDGSNQLLYPDGGTDYLDDVAAYLHNTDFSESLKDKQDLTIYTIGFTVDSPLLQRTASSGGGKYFYCHNSQQVYAALDQIINEILGSSTSFVAPVVPISQMQSTTAGNRLYLAMFKSGSKSFWGGNIKKYQLAAANSETVNVGDILDSNGSLILDSENMIKDSAKSYWSPEADGGEVEFGGVGEILQKRIPRYVDPKGSTRNIYTYLGTEKDLTHSSNAFVSLNASITPTTLGLNQTDTKGKEDIIQFIHGYDSYDENGNGITKEKRDWILGAFIHSRPLVIHYGPNPTDPSVIIVGGNDGMLHAFDDVSGEELWAFIPPNLLPKLKNLNGQTLEFFVDGAPKAYIKRDQAGLLTEAILIIGQRRGGNRYTALDISTHLFPKFLWEISPSTPGFEELGQTWSTPHIGELENGTWAAFFGGGYDENQDQDYVRTNDSKGRGVYVVNALKGTLIWSYTYAKNPEYMKYCIPSDITRVDTDGNGLIDRLYVGDIGGQIWRFDVGGSPASWTGRMIFNSNPGSSDRRKIFYPPDVTLEKNPGYYEMLFFGTGDREHPTDTTVINRLYAVKDGNALTVLTESDLVDVTSDELQTTTDETRRNAILQELQAKSGWFIKLDQHLGEKVLSPPVVYYKTAYFTTFTPTFPTGLDPCLVSKGEARTYLLQYKTGNAAFNLDASNDKPTPVLARTDRSEVIGAAIPSGVIVTFLGGKTVAYTGVGGGVYLPKLGRDKSLIPIYWRIVN